MLAASSFESFLPDFSGPIRMGEKGTYLLQQIIKSGISDDFFSNFVNPFQFRMILCQIEPPAHGYFEIPSLQTVGIGMADHTAESEIDPASGIQSDHLFYG